MSSDVNGFALEWTAYPTWLWEPTNSSFAELPHVGDGSEDSLPSSLFRNLCKEAVVFTVKGRR